MKGNVEAYVLFSKQCRSLWMLRGCFLIPGFLDSSNNNLGDDARGFSPRVLCGSHGQQASKPPCEVTPASPWASVLMMIHLRLPKFAPTRDEFIIKAEKQNERSGILLLLES